jgi:hypothetical protein
VSFLKKKRLLAKRILPDTSEEELTNMCRPLLNNELIKYSAFANPRMMDELVMEAKKIEEVLANEKAPTTTKNTTPQQPPRCQYCPERHFHRDCPELQRLRDASGSAVGPGSLGVPAEKPPALHNKCRSSYGERARLFRPSYRLSLSLDSVALTSRPANHDHPLAHINMGTERSVSLCFTFVKNGCFYALTQFQRYPVRFVAITV